MVEGKKYGKEKIVLLCGVFLVITGLGITLPVLPFYIEKLLAFEGISSKIVSLHVGLITAAFPPTQFLFSSYLGSLSITIAGLTSIGFMTIVNFIINSDFKWVLFRLHSCG